MWSVVFAHSSKNMDAVELEQLWDLMKTNEDYCIGAAENPQLPSDRRLELAGHKALAVRCAFAGRSDLTKKETLLVLSDRSSSVTAAWLRKNKLTGEHLELAAKGKKVSLTDAILENCRKLPPEEVSPEGLRLLLGRVLSRKNIPSTTLSAFTRLLEKAPAASKIASLETMRGWATNKTGEFVGYKAARDISWTLTGTVKEAAKSKEEKKQQAANAAILVHLSLFLDARRGRNVAETVTGLLAQNEEFVPLAPDILAAAKTLESTPLISAVETLGGMESGSVESAVLILKDKNSASSAREAAAARCIKEDKNPSALLKKVSSNGVYLEDFQSAVAGRELAYREAFSKAWLKEMPHHAGWGEEAGSMLLEDVACLITLTAGEEKENYTKEEIDAGTRVLEEAQKRWKIVSGYSNLDGLPGEIAVKISLSALRGRWGGGYPEFVRKWWAAKLHELEGKGYDLRSVLALMDGIDSPSAGYEGSSLDLANIIEETLQPEKP